LSKLIGQLVDSSSNSLAPNRVHHNGIAQFFRRQHGKSTGPRDHYRSDLKELFPGSSLLQEHYAA